MLFNLNNKIFVIEGDYWFHCIFYFVFNNLFNYNIKFIYDTDEIDNDIFNNNSYAIRYKDEINLDFFYKNKIPIYVNVLSEKQTKKIKEKYINLNIINNKNIINFYDLLLEKNLLWKEIKEKIGNGDNFKKSYMDILGIPEELVKFNIDKKNLDFSMLNKLNAYDDSNKIYFYSQYKSKKLNFLIKSMISLGYSENECISFFSKNANKVYTEKHILYSIKNINSTKFINENFYLFCVIMMYKSNFLINGKWFNLLYFILDSISNNNLNKDEKDNAKKLIKRILNKKVYYV